MRCQFYDGRKGGKGRCTKKATRVIVLFFSHIVCAKHAREFQAASRIGVEILKLKP